LTQAAVSACSPILSSWSQLFYVAPARAVGCAPPHATTLLAANGPAG